VIICKNLHEYTVVTDFWGHKNIQITQHEISQSYTVFSTAGVCQSV